MLIYRGYIQCMRSENFKKKIFSCFHHNLYIPIAYCLTFKIIATWHQSTRLLQVLNNKHQSECNLTVQHAIVGNISVIFSQ